MVVLEIDFLWHPIGDGEFFHSFFSTICARLEDGHWGKRYPYIMKKMYNGRISWRNVKHARKELEEIRAKLRMLPPSYVVWDINDLSKMPPWGNNISNTITDMSNYFVTSDGRDLISVIFAAFDDAERERHKIEVVSV